MFDQVHTITDWYDGPKAGIADLDGVAHLYAAKDGAESDEEIVFLLSPVDAVTLDLALEDWAIWQRWEDAFHRGLVDLSSHPALPGDRARHEELKRLLADRRTLDPKSSVRKLGEFRARADAPERPRGVIRSLEVRWRDPE